MDYKDYKGDNIKPYRGFSSHSSQERTSEVHATRCWTSSRLVIPWSGLNLPGACLTAQGINPGGHGGSRRPTGLLGVSFFIFCPINVHLFGNIEVSCKTSL